MKGKVLGIMAVIFLGMTACSQEEPKTTTQEVQIEQKATQRVTKAAFKAVLEQENDLQLIDVRTPEEFVQGTIHQAKNIDFWATDFQQQIDQLDKNKTTLIFCRSGNRSGKALKLFKQKGFQNVLELEGGYSGW